MAEVVVVGGCNMDLIALAERAAAPGPDAPRRRIPDPAGPARAPIRPLPRRGSGRGSPSSVGWARDDFGLRLRRMLADEGVEVRHTGLDPEQASGVALITVDHQGENTIVVASGANACLDDAGRRRRRRTDPRRRARCCCNWRAPSRRLPALHGSRRRPGCAWYWPSGRSASCRPSLLRQTSVLVANRQGISGQMAASEYTTAQRRACGAGCCSRSRGQRGGGHPRLQRRAGGGQDGTAPCSASRSKRWTR